TVGALAGARVEGVLARERVQAVEQRQLDLLVVSLYRPRNQMPQLGGDPGFESALVDEAGLTEEARLGEPEPGAQQGFVLFQLRPSPAGVRHALEQNGLDLRTLGGKPLHQEFVAHEVAARPVAAPRRLEDECGAVARAVPG